MSNAPWEPGRWWILHTADDTLKCETSSPNEIRDEYEPGDKIYRQFVRNEEEFRPQTLDELQAGIEAEDAYYEGRRRRLI